MDMKVSHKILNSGLILKTFTHDTRITWIKFKTLNACLKKHVFFLSIAKGEGQLAFSLQINSI